MGMLSRQKGKRGEREIANLISDITGWDVQRRVRQYDGDSDLLGVPGWSVEVKRYAQASPSSIRGWWEQAVLECEQGEKPVLFYRVNRGDWRAVWPLYVLIKAAPTYEWLEYEWTTEGSVQAWAAVARDAT